MPAQASKSKDSDLLPALRQQYPKIDFDKFIALNNANYSSYELAEEFDVSQVTCWRIKSRLNNVNSIIEDFKNNKIDYLLTQQYQAITLQAKIIEFYLQDSEFDELKSKEKVMLLMATNRIAGTLEDKQHMIVNVKGNVQINNVNVTPEEMRLLKDNESINTITTEAIDTLPD